MSVYKKRNIHSKVVGLISNSLIPVPLEIRESPYASPVTNNYTFGDRGLGNRIQKSRSSNDPVNEAQPTRKHGRWASPEQRHAQVDRRNVFGVVNRADQEGLQDDR